MLLRAVPRDEVDCSALGRRVSVRYLLEEGRAADVVGILQTCDDNSFGIRDRRETLVRVPRERIVASRIVRPRGQESEGRRR